MVTEEKAQREGEVLKRLPQMRVERECMEK